MPFYWIKSIELSCKRIILPAQNGEIYWQILLGNNSEQYLCQKQKVSLLLEFQQGKRLQVKCVIKLQVNICVCIMKFEKSAELWVYWNTFQYSEILNSIIIVKILLLLLLLL